MICELVLDGAVVDGSTRDFGDETPPDLPPAKGLGAWLPVVVIGDDPYDAAAQRKTGPVKTVGEDAVTWTYTVTDIDLEELRAPKLAQISAEFARRNALPIRFTMGGEDKLWDADDVAIARISGIVLLRAGGAPMPDPRPWTASGELLPTTVTIDDLTALGAAIAMRQDALFVVKKTLEYQVGQLATAADVLAFDPLAGWPD